MSGISPEDVPRALLLCVQECAQVSSSVRGQSLPGDHEASWRLFPVHLPSEGWYLQGNDLGAVLDAIAEQSHGQYLHHHEWCIGGRVIRGR